MILRTPDERFAAVGAPAPAYVEHDGVRLAYVDEGPPDGSPVWFMHGEPTWSYLWRDVMAPVRAAGHRCIAPDLPGFGRSDKPADLGWYSYDAHVAGMTAVLEHLDLRGATMVVHDWGGPIGMRLFAEHPDRFDRLVILDTGFFTGEQRMTDAWRAFRDFVERTEDLPIGFLVNGGCATELPADVVAAYEAPFPDASFKAGPRAFPLILPTTPDAPGAAAGRAVRDAMAADPRPKLLLWGADDPIIPPAAGQAMARLLGAPEPELIAGASHFLQEDAGDVIGGHIARWLTRA